MTDLIHLTAIIAVFALCAVYLHGCSRLGAGRATRPPTALLRDATPGGR